MLQFSFQVKYSFLLCLTFLLTFFVHKVSIADYISGQDRSSVGSQIYSGNSDPSLSQESGSTPQNDIETIQAGKRQDPPTSENVVRTIQEDTPYTFSLSDFPFEDNDPGDVLESVIISEFTGNGKLTMRGFDLTENITQHNAILALIRAGLLVFTPGKDEHGEGYSSFLFKVSDNIVQQSFSEAYRFTFNVEPVNDPPIGSLTLTREKNPQLSPFGVFKVNFFGENQTGVDDPDGMTMARSQPPLEEFFPQVSWVALRDGVEVERTFLTEQGEITTRLPLDEKSQYIIQDIDRGVMIKARVFYRDDDGTDEMVESNLLEAIPPTAPSALTREDINILSITPYQFTVEWNAQDDGGSPIEKYELARTEYFPNFDFLTSIEVILPSELQYTFTGLRPSSSYLVRIRAKNAEGSSDWFQTEMGDIQTADVTVPGIPTDLTVDETESDALTLTWAEPAETGGAKISGYIVQHKLASESDYPTSSTTVTTTGTTISSLNPGTRYDVRVAAKNEIGTGPWLTGVGTTAEVLAIVPDAPTDVTVNVASGTSLHVSWTAPADDGGAEITGYDVQYLNENRLPIAWTSVTLEGTNTETTIRGLVSEQEYFIKVAAINSVGTGAYSKEEYAILTPLPVPDAPNNLIVDVTSETSVYVIWDVPSYAGSSEITGYDLQYREGSESLISWNSMILDGYETETEISELTAGKEYFFKVAAINSEGIGAYTEEVSAVLIPLPDAPTGLIVKMISENRMYASWDPPTSTGGAEIIAYHVQYRNGRMSPNDWANFSPHPTETEIELFGLTSGLEYFIRVAAINSAGTGAFSEKASTIMVLLPDAPTDVTVELAPESSLHVSWDAPTNIGISAISGYDVQYRDASVSPISWNSIILNSSETETTISGLNATKEYLIKVAAINSAGTGSYSEEVSATLASLPNAPTSLIVEVTSETTLRVTWDAPTKTGGAEIIAYDFQCRDGTMSHDDWISVTPHPTVTEIELKELTSGIEYFFQVAAINSAGMGTYSEQASAVMTLLPDAPTGVAIQVASESSLSVTWDPPENTSSLEITGYDVQYRDGSESPISWASITVDHTNTEATISELSSGKEYFIRVAAINSAGTGAYSKGVSATLTTFPEAPTGVTVELMSETTLFVTWNPPKNTGGTEIIAYDFQCRDGTMSHDEWVSISPHPTITEIELTELTAGMEYFFQVAAINSAGIGTYSEEASALLSQRLQAPTNVTVEVNSETTLGVTWDPPTNTFGIDIEGYDVQYRDGNESPISWTSVAPNPTDTETTISGLTTGHEYFILVAAINSDGIGTYSEEVSAILTSLPEAPTGVTVELMSETKLFVTWDAPENSGGSEIIAYDFQCRDGTMSHDNWVSISPHPTGTEITLTELTVGMEYYFQVAAINSAGIGAYSEEASALLSQRLQAPTNVTVEVNSETTLGVTWDPPTNTFGTDIEGYDVQYRDGNESPISWTSVAPNPTDTETTISGLTTGYEYFIRVAAINSDGIGTYSEEVSATLTSLPEAPTGVTVELMSETKLFVTWDAPENSGGSEIIAYDFQCRDGTMSHDNWVSISPHPTGTEITLKGLTSGMQYFFQVAAINSAGTGAFSEEASAVMSALPEAPTSLTVEVSSETSLHASWDPPQNAAGMDILKYDVQYRDGSLSQEDWISMEPKPTDTEIMISGLTSGKEYFIRVAAINSAGRGTYSEQASATPAALPGAPTSVTVELMSETKLFVTWDAPKNTGGTEIISYDFQCRDRSMSHDEWVSVTPNPKGTEITLTGLTAGQEYFFQVAAINSAGIGTYSEQASAMMIEAVGDISVETGQTVSEFTLLGNYPNPFNPSTNIIVDLPTTTDLAVEVFNLLGQRVHVEEFSGVSAGVSRSLMLTVPNLPSSVYIYRIIARQDAGVQLAQGQMTLMK